jgi:hypothetical protein
MEDFRAENLRNENTASYGKCGTNFPRTTATTTILPPENKPVIRALKTKMNEGMALSFDRLEELLTALAV